MGADQACADHEIAVVICSTYCTSHLWHATERGRVDKGTTQEAYTPRQTAEPDWTSFEGNDSLRNSQLKN